MEAALAIDELAPALSPLGGTRVFNAVLVSPSCLRGTLRPAGCWWMVTVTAFQLGLHSIIYHNDWFAWEPTELSSS